MEANKSSKRVDMNETGNVLMHTSMWKMLINPFPKTLTNPWRFLIIPLTCFGCNCMTTTRRWRRRRRDMRGVGGGNPSRFLHATLSFGENPFSSPEPSDWRCIVLAVETSRDWKFFSFFPLFRKLWEHSSFSRCISQHVNVLCRFVFQISGDERRNRLGGGKKLKSKNWSQVVRGCCVPSFHRNGNSQVNL